MKNIEFLQIFPDSTKYETTLTKKVRNRKSWQKPDPREIFSIIPGTVSEILVKVSDQVTSGQQIMVYEAMKMKNIIRAPFAGKIEKILVKEGEKLAKGTLMIYISTSNAPDPIG